MTAIDKLYFATGNPNKVQEAEEFFPNIEIEQVDIDPTEVMDEDLEVIARTSVETIPESFDNPIFVEDSGLFIEELEGFPGPISGYVHHTLGNEKIQALLKDTTNRSAYFESVIAVRLPEGRIATFTGRLEGKIAEEIRGEHGFDYDSIFIPEGADRTMAEMTTEEKNEYSHRGKAMEEFADFLG